jgi:GTP-binding protein Era
VELLAKSQVPVILGMNKIDQQPEADADAIEASYQTLADAHGWPLVKFSALTEANLDGVLQALIDNLEPGPYYYPPDLVTDQPERFIMGELIREQILTHTREEVPHSVAIAIDRVEEDAKITRILATIHVERDSQKGILIGKKGSMLKTIGTAAREQIQKLVMGQVYLEMFVKVVPKWRQSRSRLEDFGYRLEE